MINLEKYDFSRDELIVAVAIKSYLQELAPDTRKEMMTALVHQDGAETVIEGEELAELIENARAAAMLASEAWQPGEGDYQKSLEYIREQLPKIHGRKFAQTASSRFAEFIEDCAAWSA